MRVESKSGNQYRVDGVAGIIRPLAKKTIKLIVKETDGNFDDKAGISIFKDDSKLNLKSNYRMKSRELRKVLKFEKPDQETVLQFEEKIQPLQSKFRFPCEHCGKPFKYKMALISHCMKEHQIRLKYDFKCEAPSCEYVGENQKNLTAHVKKQHKGKTQLQCEECGVVSYGDENIKKHNILFHKPTECKICKHMFDGKKEVMKHVRNKHSRLNGEPRPDELKLPPPCTICGAQYSWKSGLRGHMKKAHSAKVKALKMSEAGGEGLANHVTTADGVKGGAVAEGLSPVQQLGGGGGPRTGQTGRQGQRREGQGAPGSNTGGGQSTGRTRQPVQCQCQGSGETEEPHHCYTAGQDQTWTVSPSHTGLRVTAISPLSSPSLLAHATLSSQATPPAATVPRAEAPDQSGGLCEYERILLLPLHCHTNADTTHKVSP